MCESPCGIDARFDRQKLKGAPHTASESVDVRIQVRLGLSKVVTIGERYRRGLSDSEADYGFIMPAFAGVEDSDDSDDRLA